MHAIHIVSPSGAIAPTLIEQAAERLRSWGMSVTVGEHACGQSGRFAATDDERLLDLHTALRNPEVDIVLCSRGGYGLQRIIDRVGSVRKPIIGFSDITCLHQLCALTGQPSVHGIMCKHIAELGEDDAQLRALRDILCGSDTHYQWGSHPLNQQGEAHGPIVGGNLSVLYGLQGTPYSLQAVVHHYAQSGQRPILLIEDIAERHYHLDRMMQNLRLSGVLGQIGGLIIGQFSDCTDDPGMGEHIADTLVHGAMSYDIPVVVNAPVGHVVHNMPILLNSPARLLVEPGCIQLDIVNPLAAIS